MKTLILRGEAQSSRHEKKRRAWQDLKKFAAVNAQVTGGEIGVRIKLKISDDCEDIYLHHIW